MVILVPWLPGANAVAPFPELVLVDWWYWRKISDEKRLALIAHEWKHHEQQRRDGWLTFLWRWFTDKEARKQYERRAELEEHSVFNRLT